MTHSTLTHHAEFDIQTAFPLLRLLNPKQYTRIVLLSLAIGLLLLAYLVYVLLNAERF